MAFNKVVLLACGSYNPPTNMHLRMFEIARDHLHRLGNCLVVGGLISPVHDSYGKAELAAAKHRLAMLKLALHDNTWIRISDWETKEETWTRTRRSLQYHQNLLNSCMTNGNLNETNLNGWLPDNFQNEITGPIQVKLLCGADLLESFATPGLWNDDDISSIVGEHGLVVISRHNSDPLRFIYNSDILTKYMANITIVTEWITNEVSSSKVRKAIRRSESVKYLIPDKVIDYIRNNALYGASNKISGYSLTPSPSDALDDFSNGSVKDYSSSQHLQIDEPDALNLVNSKNAQNIKRHPGQAVKVYSEQKKGAAMKEAFLEPACIL